MDDRRFRLKELEKGDVAMFDYLQHQMHFNNDGMFMTGRTDKKPKDSVGAAAADRTIRSQRWISRSVHADSGQQRKQQQQQR